VSMTWFGAASSRIQQPIENAEYWKAQVPIVRSFQRAKDDSRYWADYYKNTGFRPRYPGRVYANSGLASDLTYAVGKVYKNLNKVY